MSFRPELLRIKVEPYQPRDWFITHESDSEFIVDLLYERKVLGLDWHVWNTGSDPLTITLEGTHSLTCPAGSDRGFDNVKFSLIKITATSDYSLALAGIKVGRENFAY